MTGLSQCSTPCRCTLKFLRLMLRNHADIIKFYYLCIRIMKFLVIIILLLTAFSFSGLASAGVEPESGQLKQAAVMARQKDYEKALALYRRISEAYDVSMTRERKAVCLDAVYAECGILLELGRYAEALDYLLLAEQIAEHDGLSQARLHLYYGVFYFILASQTDADPFIDQLIEHDRLAFSLAVTDNDIETMYRAFSDLLTAYSFRGGLEELKPQAESLKALASRNDALLLKVAMLQYKAALANAASDYGRAADIQSELLALVPATDARARLRALVYKDRGLAVARQAMQAADLATKTQLRHEAFRMLQKAMALTYRFDLRDVRLAVLNIEYELPSLHTDTARAEAVNTHRVALRDSLRSSTVAGEVIRMDEVKRRRALQTRIEMAEVKARVTLWLIIILTLVVAVIAAFLSILHRKNKRLRQHSALLLERMRSLYQATPSPQPALTAQEAKSPVKYENSRLSDEEKQEIAEAIRQTMSQDIIFSSELSLTSFAAHVGRHPKVVSQVIHEAFDCNFSTLVNRARIVEVCRRMDLPQYAEWSVEGIGESVGFKSRTALSSNFRRFTGLGIRDYRKAAGKK